MKFPRKTVREKVCFEGVGLHTAVPVHVIIHPADDGIVFRKGAERWPARPENVTDTTRCTKLGDIGTVEHLMSAFAALEITDAEVEVDAVEMPAMGGCSSGYVELLNQTGYTQTREESLEPLFKRVFHQEGSATVAVGSGTGHWKYSLDLGARWCGAQTYESIDVLADYTQQIAPARTFALEDELPTIAQLGLGKGLDEETALVLTPDGFRLPPRFPDEPARHKLLDLIGDLYLAGVPVRMLNVAAERSGHRINVEAARRLVAMLGTT